MRGGGAIELGWVTGGIEGNDGMGGGDNMGGGDSTEGRDGLSPETLVPVSSS